MTEKSKSLILLNFVEKWQGSPLSLFFSSISLLPNSSRNWEVAWFSALHTSTTSNRSHLWIYRKYFEILSFILCCKKIVNLKHSEWRNAFRCGVLLTKHEACRRRNRWKPLNHNEKTAKSKHDGWPKKFKGYEPRMNI